MPTLTTDPLAVMASLRLEDGRPWIDVAEQFQIDDARAILAPGADDPRLHWLGRPKGGSKSTDLGGVAIAWLLTMARPLDEGYALASDGDQAKRLLARAAGLIARTPGWPTTSRCSRGASCTVARGRRWSPWPPMPPAPRAPSRRCTWSTSSRSGPTPRRPGRCGTPRTRRSRRAPRSPGACVSS